MSKRNIDVMQNIIYSVKEQGLSQLTTENYSFDGRTITIRGSRLVNFGSCSYLGLEVDERLKNGAISAIKRYGVQYSSSRAYVAPTPYIEYEQLISKIFGAPVALTTSVSLGHHSVMPVVVEDGDAIILDQQVHASVQDAALKMTALGNRVRTIRHNDLNDLKKK